MFSRQPVSTVPLDYNPNNAKQNEDSTNFLLILSTATLLLPVCSCTVKYCRQLFPFKL
jgi:hypothetical protein